MLARGAERWCHHERGDAGWGETSWRWEGVRSSDSGHGWASDSGHGCEEGSATLLELITSEDIYLVNFYGRVYKLDDGAPSELLRRRLWGARRTDPDLVLKCVQK